MSVSELEIIGYDSAMSEVADMIRNALKNEQLDRMPASMALRILLASIEMGLDLDQFLDPFKNSPPKIVDLKCLRNTLDNRGSFQYNGTTK